MKTVSGQKFVKLMQEHGWDLARINGSHHIFTKPGETLRISVPVHGNKELKKGLLLHLLKISGMDESEL